MEVKYSVTKKQVMARYYSRWRQSLWKYHVFIFIVMYYLVYSSRFTHNWDAIPKMAISSLAGLFVVAILPFIPLILHKASTRVLAIKPEGIETSIGNKHAIIPWNEIKNIEKDTEFIFITGTNNNEFMIPLSIFANQSEMEIFYRKLTSHSTLEAGKAT